MSNSGLPLFSRYEASIDHIAIAVKDLDEAVLWFTTKLGFSCKEQRTTTGSASSMKSVTVECGSISIVLLQGLGETSQISRFIERYGPGVQHIAFRVTDAAEVVKALSESGVPFDTPLVEAPGIKQAFSQRDLNTGIMFEIIERGISGFSDQNVSELFSHLERSDSV